MKHMKHLFIALAAGFAATFAAAQIPMPAWNSPRPLSGRAA